MELSAQVGALVFLWCDRVFSLRRKTVAAPYISFSLIIVKSFNFVNIGKLPNHVNIVLYE